MSTTPRGTGEKVGVAEREVAAEAGAQHHHPPPSTARRPRTYVATAAIAAAYDSDRKGAVSAPSPCPGPSTDKVATPRRRKNGS